MAELSPGDLEIGESPACEDQAEGVIERLSEADTFLAGDDPFLELSPVSENPGQITADHHGRKTTLAKLFPTQIAFEQRQDVQDEMILGPSIVARPHVGRAEVDVPPHLEWNISQNIGDGLGALAEPDRFRRMTSDPEVEAHLAEHPPESPLIVECPGQAFGFAKIARDPCEF